MSSALYFILLFSGLWTPAICVARQFYVVDKKINWTEAQDHCRRYYTDMATTENQEDMDTIRAILASWPNDNYWLGLRLNIDQKDHNLSWVWSDGSNFTYSYWATGQPSYLATPTASNCCVHLCYSTIKWHNVRCNGQSPFVCYKKINLILVQQQMTWREALRFCRENYVDLVSVHTNETQNWVATITKHANTSNVWMGLRYVCNQQFWFWVSGSTVCYQNWALGNGTGVEDCSSGKRSGAVQSGSKKWISLPDTEKLNFICTV